MSEVNPIYKYLKSKNLTTLDESSWVQEYSNNQEKQDKLYNYLKKNGNTTLEKEAFVSKYLQATSDVGKQEGAENVDATAAPIKIEAPKKEETSLEESSVVLPKKLPIGIATKSQLDYQESTPQEKQAIDDINNIISNIDQSEIDAINERAEGKTIKQRLSKNTLSAGLTMGIGYKENYSEFNYNEYKDEAIKQYKLNNNTTEEPTEDEYAPIAKEIYKSNELYRLKQNKVQEYLENKEDDFLTTSDDLFKLGKLIHPAYWDSTSKNEDKYKQFRDNVSNYYKTASEENKKAIELSVSKINSLDVVADQAIRNISAYLDDNGNVNQNAILSQEDADIFNQNLNDIKKSQEFKQQELERYQDIITNVDNFDQLVDLSKRSYNDLEYHATNVAAGGLQLTSGLLNFVDEAANVYESFAMAQIASAKAENPLTAAESVFKKDIDSTSIIEKAANKVDEVSEEMRSSVRYQTDDINSAGDFLKYTADVMSGQAANTALMLVAPQASLYLMTASTIGSKGAEMEKEYKATGKDADMFKYYVSELGYGMAEYASERISLGQIGLAKKSVQKMFSLNPALMTEVSRRSIISQSAVEYGKNVLEESASEGLAQFGQNAVDIMLLDKKMSVWQGVDKALLDGAIMSGLGYQVPVLGQQIYNVATTPKEIFKLNANAKEIQRLKSLIPNRRKGEKLNGRTNEEIQEIKSRIDELVIESASIRRGAERKIDSIDGKAKTRLINIETKTYEKKKEFNDILNSESLSEDAKKEQLQKKIKEINSLSNSKENILNNAQYMSELNNAIEVGAKRAAEEGEELLIVNFEGDSNSPSEILKQIESKINASKLSDEKKKEYILIAKSEFATEEAKSYLATSHGFFIPNTNIVVGQKKNALSELRGNAAVFGHEVAHATVMKKLIEKGVDLNSLSNMLEKYARRFKGASKIFEDIDARYRSKEDLTPDQKLVNDQLIAEEKLIAFSQWARTYNIEGDLTLHGKLASFWDKTFSSKSEREGISNVREGRDVYDFIVAYNDMFKSDDLTELSKQIDAANFNEKLLLSDEDQITLKREGTISLSTTDQVELKSAKEELKKLIEEENAAHEAYIAKMAEEAKLLEGEALEKKKKLIDKMKQEGPRENRRILALKEKIKNLTKNDIFERTNSLYDSAGASAATEIASDWINEVERRLKNSPQFSGYRNNEFFVDKLKDIARDAAIGTSKRPSQSVSGLVKSYKPESGLTLSNYINTFIQEKILDVIKNEYPELSLEKQVARIGDRTEVGSIQLGQEETIAEYEDQDISAGASRTAKVKRDRSGKVDPISFLPESIREEVVNEIKEKAAMLDMFTLSFSTLRDLAEVNTAKMFGVKLDMLNVKKRTLSKQALKSAQDEFMRIGLENIKKILPFATVPGEDVTIGRSEDVAVNVLLGTSTGLSNNVLEAFYEQRDRVKTPAGIPEWTIREEVTTEQIANFIGLDKDGNVLNSDPRARFGDVPGITGQNAKGLMELVGRVITNKAVRDEIDKIGGQEIVLQNIAAGKSKMMWSLDALDINEETYNNYYNIKFSKADRSVYENMLLKNKEGISKEDATKLVDDMFKYVDSDKVPSNKKSKFEKLSIHYMKNSNFKLPEDGYKLNIVEKLAASKSIDLFTFSNPNDIIEAFAGKSKDEPIDPDTLKGFSNKSKVPNNKNLTIYDLDNSEETRQELIEVVRTHFGEKSSPWCITVPGEDGSNHWNDYGDKKKVVFYKGKLLACGTISKNSEQYEWWDRQNKKGHTGVPIIRKNKEKSKLDENGNQIMFMETLIVNPINGKEFVDEYSLLSEDVVDNNGKKYKKITEQVYKRSSIIDPEVVYDEETGEDIEIEIDPSLDTYINAGTIETIRYDESKDEKVSVTREVVTDYIVKRINGVLRNKINSISNIVKTKDKVSGKYSKVKNGDQITVNDSNGLVETLNYKMNVLTHKLVYDSDYSDNSEQYVFTKYKDDNKLEDESEYKVPNDFIITKEIFKSGELESTITFEDAKGVLYNIDNYVDGRKPLVYKTKYDLIKDEEYSIDEEYRSKNGFNKESENQNIGTGYVTKVIAEQLFENVVYEKKYKNKLDDNNIVLPKKPIYIYDIKEINGEAFNKFASKQVNKDINNEIRKAKKEKIELGNDYVIENKEREEFINQSTPSTIKFSKFNKDSETTNSYKYEKQIIVPTKKIFKVDIKDLAYNDVKNFDNKTSIKYSKQGYDAIATYQNGKLKNINIIDPNVFKQYESNIKFSKSEAQPVAQSLRSQTFNTMLQRKTGIDKAKVYSKQQANVATKTSSTASFVRPAADDFLGLLYNFLGSGKQGDKDMEFMVKSLIKPYNNGINNLAKARQKLTTEFRALKKLNPDIVKKLNKKIGKSDFTYDQAIRVYLYDKAGYDVKGLDPKELSFIISTIVNDNKLLSFANSIRAITRMNDGFKKPDENWIGTTLESEMYDISKDINRKEFLKEFVSNKNEIFSESNLNKIQATFGKNLRVALEDSLYSMETGSSKSYGKDKALMEFTKWLNGSVAVTMFLNTRSAVLQLISATNYVNWSDNNILAAGKAVVNQKQYWEDVATIFNSEFLKERRSGMQTEVELADLKNAVSKRGKAKSAVAYLLQLGYTPTQVADSLAITMGGATFYRNRINTYKKEIESNYSKELLDLLADRKKPNLTYKEKADIDKSISDIRNEIEEISSEKAFVDFIDITQTNQQSSDPSKLSQEQRSFVGRLVLQFANTPAQYTREMKKAYLDLRNNRGDAKTNISKLIYYGAAQNLIFTALQNALFSLAFASGDEEDKDEQDKRNDVKYYRMVNGMIDTILRGSGVYGAVFSTLKNAYLKFSEEDKKQSGIIDTSAVLIELLNISPAIGSKARKIRSAIRTYDYNEDIIDQYGFSFDNPLVNISSNVITASTNIPLDRMITKISNVKEVLDADNEAWQRVALALGWSQWELGIDSFDQEKRKEFKDIASKERKKEKILKAREDKKNSKTSNTYTRKTFVRKNKK